MDRINPAILAIEPRLLISIVSTSFVQIALRRKVRNLLPSLECRRRPPILTTLHRQRTPFPMATRKGKRSSFDGEFPQVNYITEENLVNKMQLVRYCEQLCSYLFPGFHLYPQAWQTFRASPLP